MEKRLQHVTRFSTNGSRLVGVVRRVLVISFLLMAGVSWGIEVVPDTLVRVRFTNPGYNCLSQQYCLDVELQSLQENQQLYGMNIRFLYDSNVLEYKSITPIGEYDLKSDARTLLSPSSGPALFGFGGAAVFFNGYIEYKTGAKILATPDQGWTKIYSICFRVLNPVAAFVNGQFCPSLVWDMKEDMLGGIISPEGVVISVRTNKPGKDSDPAAEQVYQYNWVYDGLPDPPYGVPVSAVCLVGDAVPPVISTQEINRDLGCNPTVGVPVFRATDNCDAMVTPEVTSPGPVPNGCKYSQTWTATARDGAGNEGLPLSITWTWTVDQTPPVFTGCPSGVIDLGVNPVAPDCMMARTGITVTDGCSGPVIPACSSGAVISDGCKRTQSFTLTAVDACGNQSVCVVSYKWTVETGTPEFIGCPTGAISLGCNPAVLPTCADALALVSAVDGCSGTLTPTCTSGVIVDNGCQRSQTFTLRAVNNAGNSATCSVTWTWKVDVTAPVFSNLPVGGDLGCNPAVLPGCVSTVRATDGCDGEVAVSCSAGNVNVSGCNRSQDITYTATDQCGNKATEVVNYTWKILNDFAVPGNQGSTVACLSAVTVPAYPEVKDGCGNVLVPTGPVVGGSYDGCEGSRTYTYRYTDCGGHSHDWVYTWTIDRTVGPMELGGPVSKGTTVECVSQAVSPAVLPVVLDACGQALSAPVPVVINTPANLTCEGTRVYRYIYKDCSGLELVWDYTYVIDRVTPPAKEAGTVSSAKQVECVSQATVPAVLPVVKDVCGVTLTAGVPQVIDTPADLSCGGTREYKYVWTDCSGLSYTWSYVYTIQRTVAPSEVGGPVAVHANVETLSLAVPPVLPVVKDVCGNVLQPTGLVTETTSLCGGTFKYTYKYQDCAGLKYDWVFTYTVVRTTPPGQVGGPVPTGATVECITDVAAPSVLPLVKDVEGVQLQPVSGSPVKETTGNSCSSVTTYTYVYKDCAQLQYTWIYTVIAKDDMAPDFVVPADVTLQSGTDCTYDASPEKTGWPSGITDNCATGLAATWTDVKSAGSNLGEIVITRTWKVDDGCGNITRKVQKITAQGENIPPDLKLHDYCVYVNKYGKWTLNASEIAAIVKGTTAYCGTSTELTYEIQPRAFECKDVFAPVQALVTARDIMGNTATGTMWVTVLDTISPVAKCRDAVLYLDKFGQAFLTPDLINDGNDRESTPDWAKHFNDLEGGSYDNCGISELYLDKQLFTKNNIGKTQVLLTAVDPSGNDGSCRSWVTVYDTITAPVTIPYVNSTPTLKDIGDLLIVKEPLSFEVKLTGITAGKEKNQVVTSVTARTDNGVLLPGLVVLYERGSETGILRVTLGSGQSGEAMVTVRVTDDGGTDNGGVDTLEKQFRVKVSMVDGTVVVTVTDPAGTSVTTDVLNLKDELAMTLWPNPTRGEVNIDLTWSKIREIDLRVYNVLGVEVYQRLYKAGEMIRFDLSGKTSGLYLVEMNIEGTRVLHKLILDRK